MAPMPPRTAAATRSSSGRTSSSTGPTLPVAPASFKVWQIAHGGVAPLMKSARPCANWASPAAGCAAAPLGARATRSESAAPRPARCRRESDNDHLHGVIGPARVRVATGVLAALLGLDAAVAVGRTTGQDVVAGRHAQRHRELAPGEAAEV